MLLLNCLSQVTYCGGYSGEDPPLPIPNREVKLASADGTAPPGGRVGSCRFSKGSNANASEPFFLYWRGDPLPDPTPGRRKHTSIMQNEFKTSSRESASQVGLSCYLGANTPIVAGKASSQSTFSATTSELLFPLHWNQGNCFSELTIFIKKQVTACGGLVRRPSVRS